MCPPFFSLLPILAMLTLPRANARFIAVANGIPSDLNGFYFRRVGGAFVRLVLIAGRIITLGAVIRGLENAVCFFFFP